MRTSSTRRSRVPLVGVLLCVLALTGGCDDSVDPTLGTDQAFTVWGALDPTAEQQAIRVVPIQGQIDADPSVIDAVVTATDLASGTSVAFRDSFVTFDNGAQGHVFLADWTPRVGRTYRLDVRRTEDDAVSSAEVRIPDAVVPEVTLGSSVGSEVIYEVRAPAAPRVRFGELVFRVSGLPNAPDDTVTVTAKEFDPVQMFGSTWGRDLSFLELSRAFLRNEGYADRTISLVDVTYRLYVTNAEWEVPEGGFDLDQIVEPGTISNVTGGFGFIGSGYWASVTWVPALSTQVRAGFFVSEDPAAQVFINEINVNGWVELYNPTLETLSISRYGVSDVADGEPPTDPFPVGTVIPPKGYYVVDLGILVDEGTQVFFLNPDGAVVGSLLIDVPLGGELEPQSYGSYPDGFTFVPARDFPDIFRGGVVPSRGEPNEVEDHPFIINEVFAGSGGDGFVELLKTNPFAPTSWARIGTSTETTWFGPTLSELDDPFLLFRETSRIELPLSGGTIFVINQDPKSAVGRVVDVRTYGPQASGTASGYISNGTTLTWTSGLAPTPLSSNTEGNTLALR